MTATLENTTTTLATDGLEGGMSEAMKDDVKAQIGRHRRVRGTDFATNDLAAAALPYMSRMRHQVPGIYAVVLGTGDGTHVCSIGLGDALDAARISALNSSMFGTAGAQAAIVDLSRDPDEAKGEGRDAIVSVSLPNDEVIALAKVAHPPVGHLVLAVFARDVQLGMVVHHARTSAQALSEWLDEE